MKATNILPPNIVDYAMFSQYTIKIFYNVHIISTFHMWQNRQTMHIVFAQINNINRFLDR